ncbi:hypothetical protein [Enhydrobacter sp.]|jgi:hypothetical protein|uniref:hypothetical protein n=1 Tax=Enhydrobacter sp. TaxID=1894999 RepID=UPI00262C6B12|nr:hypothetical protein [Enhydrobacter sp.]WIM13853.1 MAG: hypothetical protein OJF58_004822 [Enhydrobacter sp.]
MRFVRRIAATAAAVATLPVLAHAATLGGSDYATQYDFREFYTATDNKTFRVVLLGDAFPGMPQAEVARRLLPVMQANKPPPRLTFTYETPSEEPHPDYRLMLVFNPANDLSGDAVCNGERRFKPGTSGHVYVFGVYCRNDIALSQVTGWTDATTPDAPAMGDLMKELFSVLFDRSPGLLPQHDRTLPN